MAEVAGDIFIVGTIQRMDPETRLLREENGPQVNLSQFIRNMKFPPRVLKKPAARNSVRRTPVPKKEPKDGYASQSQTPLNVDPNVTISSKDTTVVPSKIQEHNLILSQLNSGPVKRTNLQTVYTAFVSPPANLEVSSDESMLQRALEMSLKESVPACIIDNPSPLEQNFNTMSEDEQISYALKMSMQVQLEELEVENFSHSLSVSLKKPLTLNELAKINVNTFNQM